MKQARQIMGMPITVEIIGNSNSVKKATLDTFSYFEKIDSIFSTYKLKSEINKIRTGQTKKSDYSVDVKKVFKLSQLMKIKTNGYFDIVGPNGLDPSGLVKGWAIQNAAEKLDSQGFQNYYIEAGGDIQLKGKNKQGKPWKIGIKNPFNKNEIIKIINMSKGAVATSGNYEKGLHIYNPHTKKSAEDIAGITVIGPKIMETDVYATAAFAMGKNGLDFISNIPGYDCYMILNKKTATFTSGFKKYEENS